MFYCRIVGNLRYKYQNRVWKNAWRLQTRSYESLPRLDSATKRQQCGVFARSYRTNKKLYNAEKPTTEHGRIAEFERALFRRLEQAGFKRSKKFYWSVFISTILAIGSYLFFFPHKLRQQVVEEVSTVASQSLEDEKIVLKAGQLSKDVINALLNDDSTKVVASDFVKDVIVSDPIRDAAIGTLLSLLNDPMVLELLRIRLSQIILQILQDDATRQVILSQVNTILEHESIRTSLQHLLSNLTHTPEVQTMMAEFFRDVLASDTVKNQGAILGQQVTADVISNREIQEQAGNAIWAAVKHSVVPNMFKGKSNVVKDVSTEEELDDVEEKAKLPDVVPQINSNNNEEDFELPYNRFNRYTNIDDES